MTAICSAFLQMVMSLEAWPIGPLWIRHCPQTSHHQNFEKYMSGCMSACWRRLFQTTVCSYIVYEEQCIQLRHYVAYALCLLDARRARIVYVSTHYNHDYLGNQPTNNLFTAIKTNSNQNIANNSGRLPEKPYGSMNWSPIAALLFVYNIYF